jgi:hypothetical protein
VWNIVINKHLLDDSFTKESREELDEKYCGYKEYLHGEDFPSNLDSVSDIRVIFGSYCVNFHIAREI